MQEPTPGKLYVSGTGGVYRVWAIASNDDNLPHVIYGVPGTAPGFVFDAQDALTNQPVKVFLDGHHWRVQNWSVEDYTDRARKFLDVVGWSVDLCSFWNTLKFQEIPL